MILAIEHGSVVRGDSDSFSDRDLVLISKSPSILKEKKKSYKKNGYSVSTYTFQKAIYLSQSGSLFFKHIFQTFNEMGVNFKDYITPIEIL